MYIIQAQVIINFLIVLLSECFQVVSLVTNAFIFIPTVSLMLNVLRKTVRLLMPVREELAQLSLNSVSKYIWRTIKATV